MVSEMYGNSLYRQYGAGSSGGSRNLRCAIVEGSWGQCCVTGEISEVRVL